jgi:hypothetical protein
MGQAMKATTETLEIGSNETERQSVTKFLIRLAQEDENLDEIALRDRAVAALGGVAYCDMSARASSLPDS